MASIVTSGAHTTQLGDTIVTTDVVDNQLTSRMLGCALLVVLPVTFASHTNFSHTKPHYQTATDFSLR